MKRGLKILFIIVGIVVILGIIFFAVDYNRVQKQEKPIFCIQNPAGVISDGGTIEYFGLGYKVIDFHTLAGFDDIKIGTWLMDYNDFEKEMKEYEKKFEEELQKDNRNQESNINNKVTTIDIQTTGLSSETSIKKYTFAVLSQISGQNCFFVR